MSEKAATTSFPFSTSQDVALSQWSLAVGDTATPIKLGVYSDRTVQVAGTFGGATVTLQGSNNDVGYHTLTDPQGNALSFSAAGLETVMELPFFIKPVISGGDGTTALDIILSGRRSI